ncbi:PaaI family thioesterase [Cupriavidus sp. UYPR2.512]|uniref:PaaI family thioesterase n=1 Tax=Cupriavidus sp. UYPR2.512 TaxID=1080187 RepID=UPI0003776B9C|nr:PaaI family thioesterase [Cupriavidus sp. UYPR2.512]
MSNIEHDDVWIQKEYSPENSHCYGCGVANPHGHGQKTYLIGAETVSRFTPDPMYSGGVPGNVYGGMIASLFDCHGAASAAAFHRQHSQDPGGPLGRFVTASLRVNFLAPTPQYQELTVSGTLNSVEGRKVWVEMTLKAGKTICATAEMLAIALRK